MASRSLMNALSVAFRLATEGGNVMTASRRIRSIKLVVLSLFIASALSSLCLGPRGWLTGNVSAQELKKPTPMSGPVTLKDDKKDAKTQVASAPEGKREPE